MFVGNQGRAQGAAGFSRLEGQAYDSGVVYFTSTQGGGTAETAPDTVGGYGNGSGQVWAYDIKRRELTCLFQSPGPLVLDLPDNVTTSKHGTLVVCEDNINDNFIRGLSKHGQALRHRAEPAHQRHRRPTGSTTSSRGRRSARAARPCS